MNTEKFADFLRSRRKELGLTQEQLAERLHVSTAAVSKWERGKSLPDIAKIEDLAAALEVSVLEVLRGELSVEPLDKEPLKEVYTQTLRTAKLQKKKKCGKAVAVLAILLLLLHFSLVISRLTDQTKLLAQRAGMLQQQIDELQLKRKVDAVGRELDRESSL